MKKLFILGSCILPTLLMGQLDRSIQPAAAKAPTINIKDSEVFTTTNGITVIVSENHKLPRVTIDVVMGSDPRIEGNKAGISELASALILSGTNSRSKDQLDQEKDYIGATLFAGASNVSLSCLTKHLPKGLELLKDVLFNANFPQAEFDRIQKQFESSLIAAKSDAGTMADNVESRVNFPNHPFGDIMTEATLKNITREDIVNYFKSTFTPKGSYIVVVGDITKTEVEKLVNNHFTSWNGPEAYKEATNNGLKSKGNRVIFVKKPGAVQSAIQISFPLDIRKGDMDQLPLSVLNGILGGSGFGTRLMQNLREDKAYTYGCYSSVNITEDGSWLSIGGNFRNEVSDSAITQILMELDKITKSQVTDEELSLTKSSMAGSFARSLEKPSTIAQFALNIIKNNLNRDYYKNYLTRLEGISKEDILKMAQTYFTASNCNIVVVGNEAIIEKLKVFDADGKIELMDAFGQEVKDTKQADISKEVLIEKYILAVTKSSSLKEATKKLKKIKSVEEKTEVSSPQIPIPLTLTKLWVYPNSEGQKMEGQGMVLQKSFFDGKTGAESNMQTGKKELTADEIAVKNKSLGYYPEMNYLKNQVKHELVGIENHGGKDVYVLKIENGETTTFDYFDLATFMKVKTTSIQKKGEDVNEVTYSFEDFKEVEGIIIPHIMKFAAGEFVMNGKITSIQVNGSSKIDDFK